MSGKHVMVRASRSGVGTPVVTVGTGLVAWVVIGLALLLLPHPQPSQLGGSAQAGPGATRPGPYDTSPSTPSRVDDTPERDRTPADVDGSSPAQPPTVADGPGSSGGTSGQTGAVEPSAPPEPSASPTASAEVEESTRPPWADAPGKAKGHGKRPQRDPDKS